MRAPFDVDIFTTEHTELTEVILDRKRRGKNTRTQEIKESRMGKKREFKIKSVFAKATTRQELKGENCGLKFKISMDRQAVRATTITRLKEAKLHIAICLTTHRNPSQLLSNFR